MPNIPGVAGYHLPSADPLPPYAATLRWIYVLLLKGDGAVTRCELVMHKGQHVNNMYDITIAYSVFDGIEHRACNKTVRLLPTKAEDYYQWR